MSLIINSSPLGTQKPNHGSWKRKATTDDEDETRGETKRSRYQWYFTLESESPIPTDEDAESVYTIQGDETEYVQDTSDTSDTSSTHTYMTSDESDNDVSIHVEFELDSESNNSIDSSSSSEPENYLVNYISCSGSEGLADDSDISRCSLDSEVSHSIFKLCLQCKTLNTNPLFRYCQKCYQTKKIQYPRINRKRRMSKSQSQLSQLSSQASERQHLQSQSLTQIQRQLSEASTVVLGNSQELGSMDSGIATSQCDLDSGIASGSSQEVEVLLVEGRTSTRISQRDEIDSGHAPTEGDSDHSYSHSDVSTGLNMTKDKTSEFQSSSSEIRTPRQPKSLMRLLQQRHRRDLANISASSGISSGSGNTSGTIPKNSSLTSFSESELMIASSTGSGQQKCHTCDENQRDAVFVHGKTCHIFCCYTCAKKAWVTHNRRCPICNRQVTQILKAFYS